MATISFDTKLVKIGDWTIIVLPKSASAKLPSRGQAMVKGTINGFNFQSALEPDGKGSHWFRVGKDMQKAIRAEAGDIVTLAIEPTKDWPEPKVPEDLKKALEASPNAHKLWKDITPVARWDWIRWINGTKSAETRKHRIQVTCAKLTKGMRRPCCFNRTECTVTEVSNSGVLLLPIS